jgi:hypothetical protein
MREIWLRTNHRALLFGCVPPALLVAVGLWMTCPRETLGAAWRATGAIATVCGLGTIALLLRQIIRPRIAYESSRVLFYLRSGSPIAVPVEFVEAFLVGQGPAHVPGISGQSRTMNLVARLSQRQPEWAQQSVKPGIGNWSDGYVTIRGAWCEPLNNDVVRRLNRRLKEVKEQLTDA